MTPQDKSVFDAMRDALEIAIRQNGHDMLMTGEELRKCESSLSAAKAVSEPPATVPNNSQDWKGMDGAIAYHLIDRHANGWADAGKMIGEWLAANQAVQPQARKPLRDEMVKQMKERCDAMVKRGAFADGWLSAEAAHGIKE